MFVDMKGTKGIQLLHKSILPIFNVCHAGYAQLPSSTYTQLSGHTASLAQDIVTFIDVLSVCGFIDTYIGCRSVVSLA